MFNWQTVKVKDCIEKVIYTSKIPKNKYKPNGKYPIVSQDNELICGYWDNPKDIFITGKPIIVFGDHTQVLKFIDFDFVLGADGVKLLRPKKFLDPKFFYYALKSINLKKLGYARHFRLLKEVEVNYPESLSEQKRLVSLLDELLKKLEKAKENTGMNLENSKKLFDSYLENIFTNTNNGWGKMTLKDVSLYFGRGKSKHRPRNDKKLYGGDYPFIQTGDVRNAQHFIRDFTQTYNETGLAQSKLWPKGTVCITIAANIAETGILGFDACFPDSIIGLVPNPKITTSDFVEYLLTFYSKGLKAKGKGSAQDNINMGTFENEYFLFPSLDEQKRILKTLDELYQNTKKLEVIYSEKLAQLEELKQSILNQAFTGKL